MIPAILFKQTISLSIFTFSTYVLVAPSGDCRHITAQSSMLLNHHCLSSVSSGPFDKHLQWLPKPAGIIFPFQLPDLSDASHTHAHTRTHTHTHTHTHICHKRNL